MPAVHGTLLLKKLARSRVKQTEITEKCNLPLQMARKKTASREAMAWQMAQKEG